MSNGSDRERSAEAKLVPSALALGREPDGAGLQQAGTRVIRSFAACRGIAVGAASPDKCPHVFSTTRRLPEGRRSVPPKIFDALERLSERMKATLSVELMTSEQDERIAAAFTREQRRLRNFIRKHVTDDRDVEDILQDVFYELVEAYRLVKPLEHVTAWLFRVARNRIADLFRRERPEISTDEVIPVQTGRSRYS